MADIGVNILLEKLLQLLTEELDLIAGVEEVFRDLLEQVQIISSFINEYERLMRDSNMWKEMDKAIRITVFKTEDIIDKYLLEARLHQGKSKVRKLFDTEYLNRVRGVAINIKRLIEEMRQIPLGARQALPAADNLRLEFETEKGAQESKGVSFEDDEVVADEVVGFDEEAQKLIMRLTKGSEELDVIPIVGMPGLGKSTLARMIYTDPQVSHEFFTSIFIHVGQSYKIKDIFLQILKKFTRNEEYEYRDAHELAKVIRSFLEKGGKALIVLDDVWNPEVVDSVMKVFPKNDKGHRMMITTCDRRVAVYSNEDPHYLKFLAPDESVELLRRKVIGSRRSYPDELIGHAKSIAEKCEGLPLSVVVIAGALRGITDRSHWIQAENNLGEYLINRDDPSNILNIVKISYDRLPQDMQSCFLYCGVFPQGFDIPVTKLIRLWIAEGLIKSKPGIILEEIAQLYLNELVNRNLVMVIWKKCDGQIKTCRLHNLLYEFCKFEASRKWFFREVSPEPDEAQISSINDPSTSRRLCIQFSALDNFLSEKPFAEHVRSFYCFSTGHFMLSPHIGSLHKAFPLIRVLDVESLQFSFSRDFEKLFHLKYIAISGDFRALPPFFGRFWNLQTLIFNTSTSEPIIEIKADIWNMFRLRHIHTNVPAKLPSPSASTGNGPSCLQTLSQVTPESCNKEVLAKACNLNKLSIRGPMDTFLESNRGGYVNLEKLKKLEELKLVNDSPQSTKVLQLPPGLYSSVPRLKKLTLSNTKFLWGDAECLMQLECLEVLKLKEQAFIGESWTLQEGEFSQLRALCIDRVDLKVWEASEHHFPRLRYLTLKNCENIEALPSELPSLQEINLENTIKAVRSAKEIARMKLESKNKFNLSISPPQAD